MKKRCNFLILVTFLGFSVNPVLLHGQGCENLISYWRLEEKMVNTYTDIIGGHDAVTISSAPSQVDGKVGKAQSFNGTSDYISISDHPDFDWSGTQSFTIEMWVKLNSIATDNNMVFIGRDETEGNIHWWIGAEKNTGKSTFVLYDSENSTNTSYGPSLSIDTWYHLVAVRDAESGNNLFYVNNTLVDSDSVDYSNGSFETDATIDIGVLNYNGQTNRFFAPAVIDEVAIYDAALTINDVNLHYNNGVFGIGYCEDYAPYFLSFPDSLATVETEFFYEAYATGLPPLSYSLVSGPGNINSLTGVYSWTPTSPAQSGSEITISATNSLGTAIQSFRVYVAEEPECPSGLQHYYKLNEDSGPPYTDFTGENNGEALNAPSPTVGKFSRAQQFDGVSNGINLPDVGTFNFPGSSSFSFEFWMKTPGKSSTMVCIGRQGTFGETDTSKLHLWVGVEATGEASFYLRDADANEPEPDGNVKGGIVNDNTWHYIVAVRDGVSRRNFLYVDGRQVAVSNEFTYSNSFWTFEGDPFNIGFLYRPKKVPDYFFNGALDEVAIYNKALSATEVAANYLQSFSGKWHCEPGNNAPAFLTDPVTSATEGEAYSYEIETNDIDQDDVLILSAPTIPGWLTFTDLNNGRANLSGTPLSEDIGPHSVLIQVTDGKTPVTQEFTIDVSNKTDPPVITTSPALTVNEDEPYSYTIEATDPDVGDVLTYAATTIPDWLTFDSETHILSGIPDNDDVGDHDVVLEVSDGTTTVDQSFTITVVDVNDPPVGIDEKVNLVQHVYPVPANEQLIIELDIIANCTITVIDMTGKHLIVRTINGTEKRISLGISNLGEGFYICKIQSGTNISIHSFIIRR
ncbi:MAG: LamG-like jellyroll fold domain-containing protein [Bacteroidales bacterium]